MSLVALAIVGCAAPARPISNGATSDEAAPPPFMPYTPPSTAPQAFPPPEATVPMAEQPPSSACSPAAGPPTMVSASFNTSLARDAKAARPPRPISGGTLIVLRDGSAALASDPDRDVVWIVDLATRAVLAPARLASGDEPGRLVEDDAGVVHVVLRSGGALAAIDPQTGAVLRRTPTCAAPRGVAWDAGAAWLHVACADGRVQSFDAATGTLRRTVTLDRDLRDVVVLGDGRLAVSSFRHAAASIIATDGHVDEVVRPASRQRKGFAGLQTLSPAVAWRLAPLPGGGALMLHQRGVDDDVSPVAGGYGTSGDCGSIVESAVTVVSPGQTPSTSPGLALSTLAVDVAVSNDGTTVAVAAPGNAGTSLPQVTMMELPTATGATGADCVAPAKGLMAGQDQIVGQIGQIVALAFLENGAIVAQSREPAALVFGDGSRVSLTTDSLADTGHTLFHANAGGGIACASCHPEGGEDGRTWSFACLGPRRTQSIRGGITGTEPFHWDGDMHDFPSLVHAVFEGRMSGPTLSAAQSNALLGWIDAIPALPNPAASSATPAAQRGEALFRDSSVGCSTCHAGAKLTNNATVDVGLGHATQVPSLRGVAWRAPFLHTGCAKTLRDRFDPACGGGDKHGRTSQLTSGQIDDLVAYLETL
ncbi:MAG TPA: c-type cytochrome [Polyangia bacterium]|nr:c-type cytochrome [Polyangia bacterium]